jgi:hypothetical protein
LTKVVGFVWDFFMELVWIFVNFVWLKCVECAFVYVLCVCLCLCIVLCVCVCLCIVSISSFSYHHTHIYYIIDQTQNLQLSSRTRLWLTAFLHQA